MAIFNVSPLGKPSDTKILANHMVPVVPIFAPNIAAIAEGNGRNPLATKPTIAVVDRELDCHRSVQTIPPRNIQYGLEINGVNCSTCPNDFMPPANILRPT